VYCSVKNTEIFQKSRNKLKILGPKCVTWSKFYTDGPKILSAIIKLPGRQRDLTLWIWASLC